MLALCLIGVVEVGCDSSVLPEKHFDDTVIWSANKPGYEVALGFKTIYCIVGKYQDLKPGLAVEMGTRIPHIFPIGELLDKYPKLATDRAKKESYLQSVQLRKRKSPLYNSKYETQGNRNSPPGLQQEVPPARRPGLVVRTAGRESREQDYCGTVERVTGATELDSL